MCRQMMFRSSAIMSDTTNIWITYGHPGIIIGVAKADGADCVAVRGDVKSARFLRETQEKQPGMLILTEMATLQRTLMRSCSDRSTLEKSEYRAQQTQLSHANSDHELSLASCCARFSRPRQVRTSFSFRSAEPCLHRI